jgi:hypothetical protein
MEIQLRVNSLLTLPVHLSSPPVFSGVHGTRSLVLYVCFVDRCLSFCTFSFGHCVVCSSSIYGFWLPLWYLQTLLRGISSMYGKILLFCFRHYISNTIWIMVWRMFIYRIKMYMLWRIKCCIKILPIYSDITLFQVGSVLLIFKWCFLCCPIMCIYVLSYVLWCLV